MGRPEVTQIARAIAAMGRATIVNPANAAKKSKIRLPKRRYMNA